MANPGRRHVPMFDTADVTLSAGDGQLIEFNNTNCTATSYRTAFSHFLANR